MRYLIVWLSLVGASCAKPSVDFDYLLENPLVEARGLPDGWHLEDMDEFFKIFAKEEMVDYLETLPPSLSRSADFLMSIPCVRCMRNYLRCKNVCQQLAPEGTAFFFDQFACFSVCWQRVVSCCVASSRSKMKSAENGVQGGVNNDTSEADSNPKVS